MISRVCLAGVSEWLQLPGFICAWSGPMLINVGDVIDGALVNAIALTGRRG